MKQIDINCDMGESYGRFKIGNDNAIFPYITSCNIACGFHGGDPLTIEKTIRGALTHGIQIGAHPAYPDLAGFGRRQMHIPADELRSLVSYQVSALKGMTESLGGKLAYVKPHGALYNAAADDQEVSLAIVNAIRDIDPQLALMGLAGSVMEEVAKERNTMFIAEAFADRRYTAGGRLMSRALAGSIISDPEEAAQQVVSIVEQEQVISGDQHVHVIAQSICIHGDNPGAIVILQAIHEALKAHNIVPQCVVRI